jgi:hypothetical protein
MSVGLLILLARIFIPAGLSIFAIFFYFAIQNMARSEKLFPIFLIGAILMISVAIMIREVSRFMAFIREGDPENAVEALDVDGIHLVEWRRAIPIAAICLFYMLCIDWLGLIPTLFLVYVGCAATLIPDRSVSREWVIATVSAGVAAVCFDLVFRVLLELPFPSYWPS